MSRRSLRERIRPLLARILAARTAQSTEANDVAASDLVIVAPTPLRSDRGQPGEVSALVTVSPRSSHRVAAVVDALRQSAPPGTDIVVARYLSPGQTGNVSLADTGGALVIDGLHASYGSALNAALARASGEVVIVVDADFSLRPGSVERLVEAAQRGRVAQALAVSASGLVLSAGVGAEHRRILPFHLLQGHVEDDPGLPRDGVDVGGLGVPVFAASLAALGGVSADAGQQEALATLSRHARSSGLPIHLESDARVDSSLHAIDPPHPAAPDSRSWEPLIADTHEFFLHSGFRVDRVLPRAHTGEHREATVVLRRSAPVNSPHATPRRRWAVKTAAHPGAAGATWGDTFFARDLAAALRAGGEDVLIDNRETIVRPQSDYLDDVILTIRGLERVPINPTAVNVLWIISHPDAVTDDELADYDIVFAASELWAAEATRRSGVQVVPLLQATAPNRFHPGDRVEELRSDVLFVGSTRNVFRPVVRDALAAGADVAIYGDGWSDFVPHRVIRSGHLNNRDAPAAYRSARIVLNDHWDDMARHGFHSNRLFDAVAAGALVISDQVPGLDDIFGTSVRSYTTVNELAQMLAPGARGWPNENERIQNAERIASLHSFDARARTLIAAVAAFVGQPSVS